VAANEASGACKRQNEGAAPRRGGAFVCSAGGARTLKKGALGGRGSVTRVWKTEQATAVGGDPGGRGPRQNHKHSTIPWALLGHRGREGDLPIGSERDTSRSETGDNGGEFDPGSGSTLAACLMHASRTGWPSGHLRGGRVRTTWAICRLVGDSFRKREVIPHELVSRVGEMRKGSQDSPDEEPASD